MAPGPAFDLGHLGRWVDGPAVVASRDRVGAFAAASNDRDQAHRAGTAVPPMFSIVPALRPFFAAVELVTPAAWRPAVVHGGHSLQFLRPVRPGERLRARAQVTGIHALRSGAAVMVRLLVGPADGPGDDWCCEQWGTAIVRGGIARANVGERAPAAPGEAAAMPEGPFELSAVAPVGADQAARYSAASGDDNAVHLDDDAARAAGFSGVILPGLCTMTLASVVAIETCCGGDPARLRRLAVRFAAPVYPGDDLAFRFTRAAAGARAFEAARTGGGVVLKQGFLQAGPS